MKKWLWIFSVSIAVVFLIEVWLSITLILFSSRSNSSIDKRIWEIWDYIYEIEDNIPTQPIVDFSVSSIQRINSSFLVAGLSLEQHLTGVKVKGEIINSTTLRYDKIKFQIEIANQKKDIYITRISPGNSTNFEVYVPDVPIENTRYGTIEYISSLVGYN